VTRTVRVEDVAREAGVSPITVSRALNSPHLVREETRERVTEAVLRTGYVVNSIASTLRSGRSNIVTVFVASLQNPHLAAEAQGIIDAFHGSRYRLMFAQTGWSGELTADLIESVIPFRPAGMILAGVEGEEGTQAALAKLDVPIVEMGERGQAVDMLVQFSSFEAGRLMGEHFGRRGFRHVAFCGHVLGHGARRLHGFQTELEAAGIEPCLVVSIEGNQTLADGVESLERVLTQMPNCQAVFYGSDLLAMGALIEARRRRIDVPGQLAIGGYGDLDFARYLDPPLTTIRISDYGLGRHSGEMLLKTLEGKTPEQRIIELPIELLIRCSSAAQIRTAGVVSKV
jgi:LacI family gluconate utilization system Gnt-I transcriptional repressor